MHVPADATSAPRPRPAGRRIAVATAIVGLILAVALVAYVGLGEVLHALRAMGWVVLAVLCASAAPLYAVLGASWFALAADERPERFWVFIWARMVRDAVGELLPLSPLGGFAFGARAAVIHQVSPATAIATTIVDVTAEFIGLLGFVALGLALMAMLSAGDAQANRLLLWAGPLGLAISAGAAAAFVFIQHRAAGPIERLVARWAPQAMAGASAAVAAMRGLYRRPGRLALASLLHLIAWVGGAASVWLALRLSGREISLSAVLAIESLLYAVRAAAFAAPMAIGVQEAGYLVIGPMFGLGPDYAIALSLMKRARDVAIGVPTLLIWQAFEARRLLAKSAAVSQDPAP
ncbi:MAG: lysylphosphatidylglycerol synthase domain-containing protein [Caulobacterales bacterium]